MERVGGGREGEGIEVKTLTSSKQFKDYTNLLYATKQIWKVAYVFGRCSQLRLLDEVFRVNSAKVWKQINLFWKLNFQGIKGFMKQGHRCSQVNFKYHLNYKITSKPVKIKPDTSVCPSRL